MGEELEFRTAVGGYKKDDVLEYVENMNDKLSQMSRAHEEETKRYQSRIQELEELLRQEEENSAALAEDQDKRLEGLAREILRLREENKVLREKLEKAEGNIGSRADYEGVRSAVSEVQYKIAEYVNVLNKTQQKLAATYQEMNGIKKKIADQLEKIQQEKEVES